jgi:hypothetical protein
MARKGRVRGGIDFMDNSIRALIDILKSLSVGPGKGIASVPFGVLFKTTVDTMPALAATLVVAKKRGVIDFEGTMLAQGISDHIVIHLLSDDVIEDSADFMSIYGAVPIKPVTTAPPANQPAKCTGCDKTVYVNERLAANGKVFHKVCCTCTLLLSPFFVFVFLLHYSFPFLILFSSFFPQACFRCYTCQCVLKLSAYAYLDEKFFCESHFKQMVSKNAGYIVS